MHLRGYQQDLIDRARAEMKKGAKRVLIQAPTGAGKTILTAFMLKEAASRGFTSWFMVHRRELINQSHEKFEEAGVKHSFIAPRYPQNAHNVRICSVQTLHRRKDDFREPDFIIWDEAHRLPAQTWSYLQCYYKNAYHIGLTATPCRLDGKGLGDHFDVLVSGPCHSDLVKQGYLSDYRLFAPSSVDVRGIQSRCGDWQQKGLMRVVDRPAITGCAVSEYIKNCKGKKAIVFCVGIGHSESVCRAFNDAGISAEHINGKTPDGKRDEAVGNFRRGFTDVLCNCDIFSEGFDVPDAEVAILLRPTQSLNLYLQQVGRVMRPKVNPAIILDHVGNCQRHGLPDEIRNWSLSGVARGRARDSSPSVKICERCFAAQPSGKRECIFCDTAFEVKPRQVKQVSGEMSEIDKKKFQKKSRQEQGHAQTLGELIALAKRRGYKPGWAYMVHRSRKRRSYA